MVNVKAGSGFSLKDQLFNKDRIEYLAELFHTADEEFDEAGFVKASMKGLKQLELKERIVHIACALETFLASDYRVATKQIVKALPPPLDPAKTDDDFGDFIFGPLGEFVVRNGLTKRHLKLSLATLKALTQRFSMEDAIRSFINSHQVETLKELEIWSTDPHYHVRRLVSEGTRPLLPWSKRLTTDPLAAIPLLDRLHTDPTRYVTRSVANHLNDIAKSNPNVVLDTLKRWKKEQQQDASELQWICQHALRTLVKQGNQQALRFLGFRPHPKIEVSQLKMNRTKFKPGDVIEFSFNITSKRDESLMIDYVIDFVKANGKLSPKVHKIKKIFLKKDQSSVIQKKHKLHANATTYKLYPGTHRITLQINGTSLVTENFEIKQ